MTHFGDLAGFVRWVGCIVRLQEGIIVSRSGQRHRPQLKCSQNDGSAGDWRPESGAPFVRQHRHLRLLSRPATRFGDTGREERSLGRRVAIDEIRGLLTEMVDEG